MEYKIKQIEDLSFNAWPSHQIEVYDGWILRFSYFYTHRTNCVEQIGVSSLPLMKKIRYCESIYKRWKTPCIFKISPIGDPRTDRVLQERGYEIQHHTTVMTLSLAGFAYRNETDDDVALTVESRVSSAWISAMFRMKNTTDIMHRRIVPSMYAAIPKDEIAVSVRENGRIVATGLGILDRDYVGVYAIHVDEVCRRKGYATRIVQTILSEGKNRGARYAYLQVVTDNAPAKALYRRLGFRKAFAYWFRVKEVS